MQAKDLTPDSLAVFTLYAKDAGNWAGQPMVANYSKERMKSIRGNLADLVKKGLIVIFESDDCEFIDFTNAGQALAAELGINLGIQDQ